MASHVQVWARVRPVEGADNGAVVVDPDAKAITVDAHHTGAATMRAAPDTMRFPLDGVLGSSATQQDAFDKVAKEAVVAALDGFNSTVMAYGQTGAGKTHTMAGPSASGFGQRGLIPRSLSFVFASTNSTKGRAGGNYTVRVSYMEVYNDKVFDLLDFDGRGESDVPSSSPLKVLERPDGSTFVRGLSTPVVNSAEEAMGVFFEGETNRTVAEHALNRESTRSHCVFTILLERRREAEDGAGPAEVTASKLNLVDLAGSERVRKTGSTGRTLKEAGHINRSLSALGRVVSQLTDRHPGAQQQQPQQPQHIGYRSSAITTVLRDSLGGNCATKVVVCLWPSAQHASETVSSLRFGARLRQVTVHPRRNLVGGSGSDGAAAGAAAGGAAGAVPLATQSALRVLRKEVLALRTELALRDAISSAKPKRYQPLTGSERQAISSLVQLYCSDAGEASHDSPPGHFLLSRLGTARQLGSALSLMRDQVLGASSIRGGSDRPRSAAAWQRGAGKAPLQEYKQAKAEAGSAAQSAKSVAVAVSSTKRSIDEGLAELQQLRAGGGADPAAEQGLLAGLRELRHEYKARRAALAEAKEAAAFCSGAAEQARARLMAAFDESERAGGFAGTAEEQSDEGSDPEAAFQAAKAAAKGAARTKRAQAAKRSPWNKYQ